MRIPDDFYTHEHTWRLALEKLIELTPPSTEPDMDDRGFWEHELRAFNRAYEELQKPCEHPDKWYDDTSGLIICDDCGERFE